jgi:hypothetical protein
MEGPARLPGLYYGIALLTLYLFVTGAAGARANWGIDLAKAGDEAISGYA